VFDRFSEILSKARSNKSANKPDTELNEFESVRSFIQVYCNMSLKSSRYSMNTDAKAKRTKPLKSALKARKQLRNGKLHGDVSFMFTP
jgi:condensin complex subunit 1